MVNLCYCATYRLKRKIIEGCYCRSRNQNCEIVTTGKLKCLREYFSPSIIPDELAMIMDRLYGGVCYAGIDTDPELKYPKVRFLFVNLFDHQQNLTRLCSPRSGCRSRRVLQPAELHRRHFSTLRAAPARRHRQTRRGETVRPGRPDVRRVPRPALRRQVCAVLLCQRYLSTGEFLSLALQTALVF